MLKPGSQTWLVGQPYSSSPAFSWDSQGAAAGSYRFIVKARDASSVGTFGSGARSWDAYVVVIYALTSTPCTSMTASTSGTNPVVITGTASGCPKPQHQFEML